MSPVRPAAFFALPGSVIRSRPDGRTRASARAAVSPFTSKVSLGPITVASGATGGMIPARNRSRGTCTALSPLAGEP